METIIQFTNHIFQPLINLGAPLLMLIVLTILGVCMRVPLSKSLEGGIKLAIALTAMGAVIGILTGAFSPALQSFVKSTGIQLSITDLGWPPLATITWGSLYTLFFLFLTVLVNIVMLSLKKTYTLDVDIFNVWHPAFCGILILFYSNNNIFLASIYVIFLAVIKLINSDLMKPTFNDLLGMNELNPTTTTHMNFLLNPVIMIFDKFFNIFFPWLDKYDFDVNKLNQKIGFWGSKFAIGMYLGIFVGLLGKQSLQATFTLAFTGGMCLELFSFIGTWFISAVEPLSQGIANFMSKRFNGRKLFIGIDWPFVGARAEMWTAANLLAPCLLIMALILPGNQVLPLGGIIAMGLTPALLIVTRAKIIRMLIIGVFMLPLFLWAGTMMAPAATALAKKVNAFPLGLSENTLITHSTIEAPIDRMISILIGKSVMDISHTIMALGALVVYVLLFIWYAKQMKKRNEIYSKQKLLNK